MYTIPKKKANKALAILVPIGLSTLQFKDIDNAMKLNDTNKNISPYLKHKVIYLLKYDVYLSTKPSYDRSFKGI